MVTSTKNPTSVVDIEHVLASGTKYWNTSTNIYTENSVYTFTSLGNYANKVYAKLYDSTAYNGDLVQTAMTLPSTNTWTSNITFTNISNITPSKVNSSNFGFGMYYTYNDGSGTSYDIRTYGYGFSIPTTAEVTSVSYRTKHCRGPSRRSQVDVVELTVTYEEGGLQSPSSNAYFGGGPAMFRSPTNLFNILKKPIWEQRSRSNRFILRNVI